MNAYVLTYCTWESYGSVLQSVALKRTLNDLGVSSKIVLRDLAPEFHNKPLFGGSLSRTMVRIHDRLIQKDRKLAFYRGDAFIRDHLDVVCGSESEAIFKGEKQADLYLAGSDQIWNPDICDPDFFLDFVPEGKKRISYAASMGKTRIPPESKKKIQQYINRFDAISVREGACRDALSELTEKDIYVHIDPTFLRQPEEWRELEHAYPIDHPYILLYAIFWDKSLNQKVEELHNRTGLSVYVISGHMNKCYANRRIFDAGPAEFLWLIDHAEMVITSSFHAVAFSILFQKYFSAVLNPSAPSRIQNLCNRLDIPILKIDDLYNYRLKNDGELISRRILQEKKAAIDYLLKAATV